APVRSATPGNGGGAMPNSDDGSGTWTDIYGYPFKKQRPEATCLLSRAICRERKPEVLWTIRIGARGLSPASRRHATGASTGRCGCARATTAGEGGHGQKGNVT